MLLRPFVDSSAIASPQPQVFSAQRWTPAVVQCTLALCCLAGSVGVQAAGAEQHAHVHGAVNLSIAVEGNTLSVEAEIPLDSLLGFERAPRTPAERQAGQAVLTHWRTGKDLVLPTPAAQCTLSSAEAESAVLKAPAAQPQSQGGEVHADMDAALVFTCVHPEALRGLDLQPMLSRYLRMARIEAQIVTPQGQFKKSQPRSAPQLNWGR